MKRLFKFVLSLVLILSMFSQIAFSQTRAVVDEKQEVTELNEYESYCYFTQTSDAELLNQGYSLSYIRDMKQFDYEKALLERATLPISELRGYGYTDEQIRELKAYANGEKAFEAIAQFTAASLSADITFSSYSTSSYAFSYSWTWSSLPLQVYKDMAVMKWSGMATSGALLGTEIGSVSSVVKYYYTTNGNYYTSQSGEGTIIENGYWIKFPLRKMDNNNANYVWAKKGTVYAKINKSGTAALAKMQVTAIYGHTTKSVSITPSLGSGMTISFSSNDGLELKGNKTKYCSSSGVIS
ncbi:MAG: hypothetical protein PUB22_09455 [Clostridiales bacterium]|nr:hypothetical protein [Clostridiales bacterium]